MVKFCVVSISFTQEEKSEEIMSHYRELMHSHSNLQRELAPYRQLVEAHLALKREHEKA